MSGIISLLLWTCLLSTLWVWRPARALHCKMASGPVVSLAFQHLLSATFLLFLLFPEDQPYLLQCCSPGARWFAVLSRKRSWTKS